LRGISCLLILICHTRWKSNPVLPTSVIGMDIFFALSGFLITGLILAEYTKSSSIDLKNFWKRRIVRLFPAFYAFFFFGALVYLISGFTPIIGKDPIVTLLSTAFYSSNWPVAFGHKLGIFTITWSLSLEEQFYIICPLFYLFSLKFFNRKVIYIIFILAVIGINIYRYQIYHEVMLEKGAFAAWTRCYHGLDTRADSLIIGSLASLLFNEYGSRIKIPALFPRFALLILFLILLVRDVPIAYGISENSIVADFAMGGGFSLMAVLASILIIYFVQSPDSKLAKLFSYPVLVKIGLMSYSLYLWHTAIFGGIGILFMPVDQSTAYSILKILIQYSIVFIIAHLSFKYIETYFLNKQSRKKKYNPFTTK
jgi:peptidoglycan/LPS O-acetylase OafA/YrhL